MTNDHDQIQNPKSKIQNPLSEPFSQIFVDRAEADWAFDLLCQTIQRLRLNGPYDQRVAVTLTRAGGRPALRLNFGPWLVLGFRGAGGQSPERVDLALLAERIDWDERFATLSFDPKEGEPEIRVYELPTTMANPMPGPLRQVYEDTLDVIAAKFQNWRKATHWKQHKPEIIDACSDPEKRERLFAGELVDPELLYGRTFRPELEIAEEEEGYGIEGGEGIEGEQGSGGAEERGGRGVWEYGGERTEGEKGRRGAGEKEITEMSLAQAVEDELLSAFIEFRENLQEQFAVRLRRKRAEQLRNLLSNPDTIDLATFNREVWVSQSRTNSEKTINPYDYKVSSLEEIQGIERAIESGELELHGNCIWGSATKVYAPRLSDDKQKISYIRQALHILNDLKLTPLQKAHQIIKIYGFGNNIATGLVMVFHPTEFSLYNERGKQILQNLGYKVANSLNSYQTVVQDLKQRLKAEDFIELDWFLYTFDRIRRNLGTSKLKPLPLQEREFFEEGQEEEINEIEDIISPAPLLPRPPAPLPPYPLPQLAEDTGLPETELARWLRALERKKQIILYGPPGTGKTYVAERLARHLVGGSDGFIELVQFHPAYAYEDFIQGLRPQAVEGGLEYPLVPGRFLEFCRQAAGRQGPCVLIVDEINRADLARVFGELMYLLEYRDRAIPLAGGGQSFQIPSNVRLIGTMNTADRSIALVDHALRRRFAFLALRPNYDLLRHYHQREATGVEVEGLIKVLQRLNKAIGDPHYEVGGAFFLTPALATDLEDIWRMEIEPYLEEYFFDQPTQVDAFRWDQVKSEILGR